MKNLAERIDADAPASAEIVPLKEAAALAPVPPQPPTLVATRRRAGKLEQAFRRLVPAVLGLALVVLVWQIAAQSSNGFPTPLSTWQAALTLFADPFYSAGPNDQGIGWNVLASLQRVAIGFGLAALVGVPAGFLLGRFAFL
ncbi:MAG: nitrate ABC transporter permease, partial [Gibbsiella quercinecans]